ncbi:hypothetical protein RIF25_09605 [Thermosynechococcaceae cyanobacterium BACA0444]|uniref:Uncharacterized protein n=1 Tax=Pseudocalidococcus azoricus BACA0444 TaxID=2918990 RepID=A0AAE4JYJ5_9CYAN|nr:hypothetical protein [Pseudocalidococcus azoricus]MDS3861059.1 hypothetical protein [Pseudocalidococcus azoricus BACA0444]
MKLAQLRHQAGEGDLRAIALLFNQALGHKGIQVSPSLNSTINPTNLILTLRSEVPPEAQSSLTLISRELLTWPNLPAKILEIQANYPGQSEELWHYHLDLTDPETLPNLAMPAQARSKISPSQSLPVPQVQLAPPSTDAFGFPIQRLDAQAWKTIGIGAVLALILITLPFLTFLFTPLITLVHELGHAACGWVFGYPAIPSFDFIYGGGITIHGSRWSLLLWAIYGGLGYLAWLYRHNRLTLISLGIFTVLYTVSAFSPIHQALFVAMGHGFELLFAGIFLDRALGGFGCRYPLERPLYAMAGIFIIFYDLRFAWRLIFDPIEQAVYREGKGGLLDHDFIRLSQEFFQVDLAIVVGLFWWLVLLTPVFIVWLYRYRQLMQFAFARLFLVKSD